MKISDFVSLATAVSLVLLPTAAIAQKADQTSLPENARGLQKKIDLEKLKQLVAACELPGNRTGHYTSNGKGHEQGKSRGHSCDDLDVSP